MDCVIGMGERVREKANQRYEKSQSSQQNHNERTNWKWQVSLFFSGLIEHIGMTFFNSIHVHNDKHTSTKLLGFRLPNNKCIKLPRQQWGTLATAGLATKCQVWLKLLFDRLWFSGIQWLRSCCIASLCLDWFKWITPICKWAHMQCKAAEGILTFVVGHVQHFVHGLGDIDLVFFHHCLLNRDRALRQVFGMYRFIYFHFSGCYRDYQVLGAWMLWFLFVLQLRQKDSDYWLIHVIKNDVFWQTMQPGR